MSRRNPKVLGVWGDDGKRVVASESYWRQPFTWDRVAEEAGERHRVFCASLADVFEDRPELRAPRARLFGLIGDTPHLDWLLLTKRPENFASLLPYSADPPANVWLGVTAEDQKRVEGRLPLLAVAPAVVRFVSCEPLLGPVDLSPWLASAALGWAIVGGESGPRRRPMELVWLGAVVDQCRAHGVPCYVKQDTAPRDGQQGRIPDALWAVKEHPASVGV
jgi:protein gp37